MQDRARGLTIWWEVGPDFGNDLFEGPAIDPGGDKGAQIRIGFIGDS
jgi:hypothetical protein